MVKLNLTEKILLVCICAVFVIGFIISMKTQEKISRANIEIETKDYICYSYKETIKINPNSLCISFYDALKEYNVEHCGEFTVKYIK